MCGWELSCQYENPSTVIPAQAGIQQLNTPRSGQIHDVAPRRGDLLIIWIPAFAGMTGI
jgi:hypothetical protein